MKRISKLAISLLLVLSLIGTASAATMSAPGVLPIVDEVVEFTIVAADTSYIADLNENTLTGWIQEKTNVKINWEEIPDSALREKVSLMLASNELPDAFMYCGGGISAADLVNYGSQGMFLPLNDLIEKYGVEIKRVFDQQATLPGAITTPDGNIYSLPGINECYHCFYSQRAWINKTWLDTLNLAYPNTLDELYNVLVAFRDKDPNGNGVADEIPMMGANTGWNSRVYDFLFNSFLYYDSSNLCLEDGKVIFNPTQDKYKEAVTYVKKLMDENLVSRTSLTQTEEQFRTVGSDAEAMKVGVGVASLWWGFLPQDVDSPDLRSRNYVGLSPLTGPDGLRVSPILSSGVGGNDFIITADCQNPEILFRLADYMYSDEATLRAQVGVLDLNYKTPPAGAVGIDGKPALYETILPTAGNVDNYTTYMPNLMLSNRTAAFRMGQMADYSDPETQWSIEPRLYNTSATVYAPYAVEGKRYPTVFTLPEESEEISRLRTQIDDYAKEQTALFLAGERSLDEWDAYIAEYEALELPRYMELMQSTYDRQYGK